MRVVVQQHKKSNTTAPGNRRHASVHGPTQGKFFKDNRPQTTRVAQLKNNRAVASSEVIQRYTDVTAVNYTNADKPLFQIMRFKYLPKFKQIQEFLSNIQRTDPHLQALNNSMEGQPDLSQLLLERMPSWSPELALLTDPVPEQDFRAMALEGKLFEDYVDIPTGGKLTHGVQSHRLQWYMIAQEFGDHLARRLYEISLDPIWENDHSSTIWNLIVDGNSADEFDFTQPGKLQQYLDNTFVAQNGKEYLKGFIQEEQANFIATQKLLRLKAYEQLARGGKPHKTQDVEGNTFSGFVDKNEKNDDLDALWVSTITELDHGSTIQDLDENRIRSNIKLEKEFDQSTVRLNDL
ncbi:MAG: LirA/MavJ family T4SS effector [Dokdonia sp.]|jgi:hypothetical protein